jgi:hypothetical protein
LVFWIRLWATTGALPFVVTCWENSMSTRVTRKS